MQDAGSEVVLGKGLEVSDCGFEARVLQGGVQEDLACSGKDDYSPIEGSCTAQTSP